MANLNNFIELTKNLIRRYVYPLINFYQHWKTLSIHSNWKLDINLYSIGQRGNDYSRHRRKVNNFFKIRNSKVLIAGCGSGNDVMSWAKFQPKEIIGIDLFSYPDQWRIIEQEIQIKYPNIKIKFLTGNLENLIEIGDLEFDIVTSNAVFEHVQNLPSVLKEFYRVLKNGGILHAVFGPLWHTHGGDHVSGYDNVKNGFAHLEMKKKKYSKYLLAMGPYQHDENDGRTWIKNNLFSYLKADQYLNYIKNAGFKKLYNRAFISEHALSILKKNQLESLLAKYDERDLLIFALSIVYKK